LICFKKNEEGQALVESVLLIFIFATLIGGIMLFSMIYIAKCRMLMGARYGAWLIVHGNYTAPSVADELKDFLANGKPSLRSDRIRTEVHIGRGFSPSRVIVKYEVGVPRAFRSFLPEKIYLKEKCVVLAHSRIFW